MRLFLFQNQQKNLFLSNKIIEIKPSQKYGTVAILSASVQYAHYIYITINKKA